MYFCDILMRIYLNIGHIEFLANVRMLKFGSELRYGIRSPNVRTPVDIPTLNQGNRERLNLCLDRHRVSVRAPSHSIGMKPV